MGASGGVGLRGLTAVLVACAGVWPALAADIRVQEGDGGSAPRIVITGNLEPVDTFDFYKISLELDRARVVFRGPGGDETVGRNIRRMIAARGYDTEVAAGAICASGCALAWAGGADRIVAGTGSLDLAGVEDEVPALPDPVQTSRLTVIEEEPTVLQNKRWIVIGSARRADDLSGYAPEAIRVRTQNGMFAAALGPFEAAAAEARRIAMIDTGQIPRDSYVSTGSGFVEFLQGN